MFFDAEAVVLIRHILLHRNEKRRGILKTEEGVLVVEPLPGEDQVLVTLSETIDEALEPVYPLKGFAFVGMELFF